MRGAIDIKKQKQSHFIERLEYNFHDIGDGLESNDLDLSDFGEKLGKFLKETFEPNSQKFGWNIYDFISGLRVGLNLNKFEPYDGAIDSMLELVQKDLIEQNLEKFDAELRNADKIPYPNYHKDLTKTYEKACKQVEASLFQNNAKI